MQQTTKHQEKQIEVINKIESQIKKGALDFSIVSSVDNFNQDPRICLTSVHFPKQKLIQQIKSQITSPLHKISPFHYFYRDSSFHMTIKNIRIVNDPPNFSEQDIKKAKQVFSKVIPKHKVFKVYFYRLFLFPMSLALVGTTDPELDEIILELDRELFKAGVADDKKYINSRFFFSNITLMRFSQSLSGEFLNRVKKLQNTIFFKPYTVDSVSLIATNASLASCERIKTWNLN